MTPRRNKFVSVTTRVVVCVLLLGGAILLFVVLKGTAPQAKSSEAGVAAPRIVVMQAAPVAVRRQWEGFGTARAIDSADVPARVTSTVIEKPDHIRPGQPVSRGQVLVRLDESDFARQVEIASQAIKDIDAQLMRLDVEEQSWKRRAELAAEDVRLAQADLERVRQALERDVAKQRELDQAQQALNTAQRNEVAAREELDKIAPRRASLRAQRLGEDAALRLASQNVERSQVVSPIDGILQAVDVELGENLMAGQRVARVVNRARMEVPLMLPSSARPLVRVGDEVALNDAGPAGRSWPARVARIAPEDDQSTRTMQVFVELNQDPASAAALAPGLFVQGVVVSGQSQERFVVPRRALDGDRVMLIEGGRVRSIAVEADFTIEADLPRLGLPDRHWTVLRDALPAEALVVVDASRALAEGSPAIAVIAGAEASVRGPALPPPAAVQGTPQ